MHTRVTLVLTVLLTASLAWGSSIVLDTPEVLVVPPTQRLIWTEVEILIGQQILRVHYYRVDANGRPIYVPENNAIQQVWTCANVNDDPATPADESSNCFTNTFRFLIREQDVGTPIGVGLRDLIWSRMRPAVLTGANQGTFE